MKVFDAQLKLLPQPKILNGLYWELSRDPAPEVTFSFPIILHSRNTGYCYIDKSFSCPKSFDKLPWIFKIVKGRNSMYLSESEKGKKALTLNENWFISQEYTSLF
jgi:hypothetical protein